MVIKLGEKVTDSISGFSGIATARTEYLFGCVRVLVEPTALVDGKLAEGEWFDEQRLAMDSDAQTGGPQAAPIARRDAPKR
jgi:hypothetical protein